MGYISNALTPGSLKNLSDSVVRLLDKMMKNKVVDFDFIAIRGMSGALIAPILALHTFKPIVIVRKEDNSHGSTIELPDESLIDEDSHSTYKYLIVDDGISTGNTIATVIKRLDEHSIETEWRHAKYKCVGVLLYNQAIVRYQDDFTEWETFLNTRDGMLMIKDIPFFSVDFWNRYVVIHSGTKKHFIDKKEREQ